MNKNILTLLVLLSLGMTACDDHIEIDKNIYPGFVLCDNHQALSLEEYQQQSVQKAVGVIFAVADDAHPTLAVMLDELPPIQYSDTLGYIQGTSGDQSAYDGYANTTALQNSYDVKTHHGSPLADAAFRYHQYGQSDYIPSVAEFKLLVRSLPVVNPIILALKGTPVRMDGNTGACWYWTSTEVSGNPGNQAWSCSAANGKPQETPKDTSYPARAICSLND